MLWKNHNRPIWKRRLFSFYFDLVHEEKNKFGKTAREGINKGTFSHNSQDPVRACGAPWAQLVAPYVTLEWGDLPAKRRRIHPGA